ERLAPFVLIRARAHHLAALHEDRAGASAAERELDAGVLAAEPDDLQHVRQVELAQAALHHPDLVHDGSSVPSRASSMPASASETRSASSPWRSACCAPRRAPSRSMAVAPSRIVCASSV